MMLWLGRGKAVNAPSLKNKHRFPHVILSSPKSCQGESMLLSSATRRNLQRALNVFKPSQTFFSGVLGIFFSTRVRATEGSKVEIGGITVLKKRIRNTSSDLPLPNYNTTPYLNFDLVANIYIFHDYGQLPLKGSVKYNWCHDPLRTSIFQLFFYLGSFFLELYRSCWPSYRGKLNHHTVGRARGIPKTYCQRLTVNQ